MWGYFIPLFIGLFLGLWGATFSWNRYYRTDIWNARKAVMLEQLLVQRKKAEREKTRYELDVDKMLDERRREQ